VKQTSLSSSTDKKISMTFQNIKSLILPAIFLMLLNGCSSKQAPFPVPEKKAATDIDAVELSPGALTAEQRVQLAQTLSGSAAVQELITATKLFYKQENHLKALWLADQILPLIDSDIPFHQHEMVQLLLVKASCLQQLNYYAESQSQLALIEQFSSDNAILLSPKYYQLLSAAFQQNQQPISAINAQLQAFSLTPTDAQNQQQIESLWLNYQSLSQWQLTLLAQDKAPGNEAWLQLTAIANKFGDQPKPLKYQLRLWQNTFKQHPGNSIAKQLAEKSILHTPIKNIAVILPLTGKQRSAGIAIQQGVLASFANDGNKQLHFLDSNIINWYALTADLAELKIDYVIGPLLKTNVDKYINHTSTYSQQQNDSMLSASQGLFDINNTDDSSTSTESNQYKSPVNLTAIDSDAAIQSYLQPTVQTKAIKSLLLNTPVSASLTENHTVLSMRPEDEAKQAATTLSRQSFQHPIVLSQKNIVSKRIAQAFVKQWQRITGNSIEVIYYDTGAQMQANIKSSLAVDKSKARINKLKSRLNQSIKTQTRNRRDIDMIYLVGTPKQTRLVKPYIEVNISPFAHVIPVYASSRSHSRTSDYSSNSDLRGLTFTEIPWLLDEEQNSDLAALSQQLWPKRSDGLSRLFAMGFDSYQLINKIPLMQQAPYIHHWGQTGVLKLGDNGILTRSLLWGSYQRNKVVSIAME